MLKKIFNDCCHLNCQEISFDNYYAYDKDSIDSGIYGTVFLRSIKESNIKIAIKEIKNYAVYQREKGILTNIRGIENFPEYYYSVGQKNII